MKARFILFLVAAIVSLGMSAQDTEGVKILVFRNNGDINSFSSDSISKVELSVFDTDSVEHSDFVSQVFYHKTRQPVMIPLAEIDSVAFGVRNIIEPKRNVRKLTDSEVAGISFFDGEKLTYDSRLNLTAGETVYYDQMNDVLPFGLCVKVVSTAVEGNKHLAQVSMCDPEEVFERYLITGEAEQGNLSKAMPKADYDKEALKLTIPEFEIKGCKIEATIELKPELKLEDVSLDFIRHNYHANILLSASIRVEYKMLNKELKKINYEKPSGLKVSIPFLGRALRADMELKGFFDLEAEVGVTGVFEQEFYASVEWNRKNGENTFSNLRTHKNKLGDTKSLTEAHLNGEIFFGALLDVSLNLIYNLAGAGMNIKAGPKLEAEFGLGVLAQLSDHFDADIYSKSHIDVSAGVKIETYYSHFKAMKPSETEKIKLPFEFSAFSKPLTLNIFPEFHTKAVKSKQAPEIIDTPYSPDCPADTNEKVDISSFSDTNLPGPVDVDFDLADKQTGATLATVELEEGLEEGVEEVQTLSGEIELSSESGVTDIDNIVARPIINYKGYRIKCQPVDVADDIVLTPLVASVAGSGSYFVSGMTPVSQVTLDGTTYIEGNLIGLSTGDPRYQKKPETGVAAVDLSGLGKNEGWDHPLIGEWTGQIGNQSVNFKFINDSTGKYNGTDFKYRYNAPLKGGIAIQLETGGTITFSIIDLSDEEMTIKMKGSKNTVSLSKK